MNTILSQPEKSLRAAAPPRSATARRPRNTRATATALVALLISLFFGPALGARAAETINYTYDPAGRLASAAGDNGGGLRYAYDKSGNLTVLAAAIDADSDLDGIDDAWETRHFGSLARNGSGDFDNDGATDLAEFLAVTDPTDAGSNLRILSLGVRSGPAVVQWRSVPGKTYRLQFKNSLSDPNWTDLGGDITATESTARQTDPAPNASSRFYRVLLLR